MGEGQLKIGIKTTMLTAGKITPDNVDAVLDLMKGRPVTPPETKIARAIVREFGINTNIPYSYKGKNYLHAEMVIEAIIREELKIGG